MVDATPGQLLTLPIAFPPGLNRTSTAAGVGSGSSGNWFDSHLIRWVQGRMRPIGGWELLDLAAFGSPVRAMHAWVDSAGLVRVAFLCETELWVLEGPDVPGTGDVLRNITPVPGITPPPKLKQGGYGNDKYGGHPPDKPGETPPGNFPNIYGSGQRNLREDYRSIGEIWRLANWGDHLIAMASSDGRLLRWIPGADPGGGVRNIAVPVPNAPISNRTFVVTAERHVMLFAMGGKLNRFGWCSQEAIEDWDFASTLNTAGFYDIEPASRIIDAVGAAYSLIFWTIDGSYVVSYRGLPYVYAYAYLGQQSAPLSGQAAVAYSGTVMWPASDGFWRFDGSQIQYVACPILDWFQQGYDLVATRAHMAGWFNGTFSEIWWCFPRKPGFGEKVAAENNTLIVYNVQEKWWSIGKLKRSCGIPGTHIGYPLMASYGDVPGGAGYVWRHEKGHYYPGADSPELPWIRSAFINLDGGPTLVTTKQVLIDIDADLDAISLQLFATKGRFDHAPEYTKGPKIAAQRATIAQRIANRNDGLHTQQGKIDYRITGRDFAVKLQMIGSKPWTFGQGLITLAPRGRRGGA